MYSILLYYKELVKSYLPTVTYDISCLFTRIVVIFVIIIQDFNIFNN
jgi:hypothetical protein